MNIPIPKSMQLPALITGVGAILFSTVAMTKGPLAGNAHLSVADLNGNSAPAQLRDNAATPSVLAPSGTRKPRAKSKCEECGVIESMRQVSPEGDSPAIYEIKVRMRDGSIRVNRDANPANWRRGEHLILLGANQP